MESKIIRSDRMGEQYKRIVHPSGLTILLYPMPGYAGAQALFGTRYGSIDTNFRLRGESDFLQVPEGIAHYLEHKLFESEDGDAFTRYAKTGASANAYTSFDRTVYLFTCTDNFEESLGILLDFVTHPYFTQQTVDKERGIIGQEIQMYLDNPEWRVYFNLLCALYHEHPVRIDIAGTIESIAEIDADLLYRCYNTFYNLRNMVLSISGNFSEETVLRLADSILKPAPDIGIERGAVHEPHAVKQKSFEQVLTVAQPLFHIGFKCDPCEGPEVVKNQMLDEILLNVIAGESSPLYRRLYDDGLVKADFGGDTMAGREYYLTMFMGESRDPYKVQEELFKEIRRMKKEGIDPALFERTKKAAYGQAIGMFGKVENTGSLALNAEIFGTDAYQVIEAAASATLEDMERRLHMCFDEERCAISVVKGQ